MFFNNSHFEIVCVSEKAQESESKFFKFFRGTKFIDSSTPLSEMDSQQLEQVKALQE